MGDTDETEFKSGPKQHDLVDLAVTSMLPDGNARDKSWMRANIDSIRAAIHDGQHSSMLYPACGTDILRPLLAYDLDEIVGVDTSEEILSQVTAKLTDLGIEFTVYEPNPTTQEFVFEIEGKQRKVTLVHADARLPHPRIPTKTDILHIYLPTGADTDSDLETEGHQENPLWIPKSELIAQNVMKVNQGGFLVLGEKTILTEKGITPPSLLDIAGLEQRGISRRHPHSVMTSWYPTREELEELNREGAILHKKEDVSDKILELVEEGLDQSASAEYVLMEIGRGNFEFMGLEGPDDNVEVALSTYLKDCMNRCSALVEKMKAAGVDTDLADRYEDEFVKRLTAAIKRLQGEFADFLAEYSSLVEKVETGGMSQDEALAHIGIVTDKRYGGYKSTRWDIALPYCGENRDRIHKIITAFGKIDVDTIVSDINT